MNDEQIVGGGVSVEPEPEEAARLARKAKAKSRVPRKASASPRVLKIPAVKITQPTPVKTSRRMSKEIPSLGDLRLAPNGVVPHGDRHLDIVFTNGFCARLFPVNFPKKETTQVRDLVVDWLKKRFSA